MNIIGLSFPFNLSAFILSGVFLIFLYKSPTYDTRITRGFSMHNVVWNVLLVVIFDTLSVNLFLSVVAVIIFVALSTVGFHESKKPDGNVTEEQPEAILDE